MQEEVESDSLRSVSSPDGRIWEASLFQGSALGSRPMALTYRLISLILIVTGLVRITGIFSGSPAWNSLLFYTVLSNILCLVWMILLIIRTIRDLRRDGLWGTSTPSPRWGGAVMMAITVTLLIYLVILVPTAFQQAGDYVPFSFTDNLIHIITPCLLIVDWLVFVGKGAFRWFDPLLWALIPYAYLVFGFALGSLGGEFRPGQKYPYPFMNIDTLGLGGVAAWIVGLSVALVAVGYVYVAIDRALGQLSQRRAPRTGSAGTTSRGLSPRTSPYDESLRAEVRPCDDSNHGDHASVRAGVSECDDETFAPVSLDTNAGVRPEAQLPSHSAHSRRAGPRRPWALSLKALRNSVNRESLRLGLRHLALKAAPGIGHCRKLHAVPNPMQSLRSKALACR